ncbi:MAG TPA: phosphodiesterase [Longimicrobiaceae bacterium]|nr:phosphodiesterase [Longimicrobiaceae bacterium]
MADAAVLLARAAHRLRWTRTGAAPFAMLCLSIDPLDAVSDALGPLWCEALLGAATSRIASCLGPDDTVAPLGGGRFAVLLAGAPDAGEALRSTWRIQVRLGVPFPMGGHEILITASVGVAPAGAGYVRAEDLLRDAHAAMGEARGRGRGLCRVFDASMHARAVERLRLEAALRRAVERGEFELHYQPIVCLADGRTAAFEALLRWRHPREGLLLPAAFLAAAETSGLVVPIGRWVLAEACLQVQAWAERYPRHGPVAVNVNLSARQLLHPGVVGDVEDALALSGLPASRLQLEITEGALMESGEAALEVLGRLKALGVRLCVDDFGVGYSSLSYLHRFPVDVLKIDRSFVAGLGSDGPAGSIVRAIVELAHGLGLQVVSEGVETPSQLEGVRALECGYAQGYLFSAAVSAEEADALLATPRLW